MSTALDWLKTIAGMTPDEFDSYMDNEGINCTRADPHSGTRTILGCPVTEEMWVDANLIQLSIDMDDNLTAIFRSGGSGGNTTNNNTWTWTIPGYGSNAGNSPASPQVTQTLYRRNTHDENGNARQFSTAQEELWQTNVEIASMTNTIVWKSAEEIANDANAYRSMMARKKTVYYSKDSAELVLEILTNNGMLEQKNG